MTTKTNMKTQQTKHGNKAQPQQTMSDATNDELERWIATTLVNDEASTDEELIEHFQQGGEVPYAQAKFYVDQRNDALQHGLTFTLKPYKTQPQHSPQPWKCQQSRYADFDAPHHDWSITRDGYELAIAFVHVNPEANAKLIVRAVNHADKLAEACKRITKLSEGWTTLQMNCAIVAAQEALAAYESEAQP